MHYLCHRAWHGSGKETMAHFKAERLDAHLQQLRRLSPAVVGSLILSSQGLPIAADLPPDMGEERSAATSAAMLALGQRISEELGRGTMEALLLGGDEGQVIIARINDEAALTVLFRPDVRVAMALLDIGHSVEQLRPLL